jgi:hypothetical protein
VPCDWQIIGNQHNRNIREAILQLNMAAPFSLSRGRQGCSVDAARDGAAATELQTSPVSWLGGLGISNLQFEILCAAFPPPESGAVACAQALHDDVQVRLTVARRRRLRTVFPCAKFAGCVAQRLGASNPRLR